MKKYIFIVALATTVMACNNNKQNEEADNVATEQSVDNQSASLDIYEKEWRLTELGGEVIVLDSMFNKKPHIIFQEDNRVSGNLGCNNFGGNVEMFDDNGVRFTGVGATQMACPNLGVEQGFLEALNNARSLHAEGDALTLSNDKDVVTARFEAVAE